MQIDMNPLITDNKLVPQERFELPTPSLRMLESRGSRNSFRSAARLWAFGRRCRVAHSPTGEPNQKKRTDDAPPKPDSFIRYRQKMLLRCSMPPMPFSRSYQPRSHLHVPDRFVSAPGPSGAPSFRRKQAGADYSSCRRGSSLSAANCSGPSSSQPLRARRCAS